MSPALGRAAAAFRNVATPTIPHRAAIAPSAMKTRPPRVVVCPMNLPVQDEVDCTREHPIKGARRTPATGASHRLVQVDHLAARVTQVAADALQDDARDISRVERF